MRINVLVPHVDISGGMRAVFEYSNRLMRRGHDVQIVCLDPPYLRRRVAGQKVVIPWFPRYRVRGHRPNWMHVAPPIVYRSNLSPNAIPDGDIVISTAWQTARAACRYPDKKGRKVYLIQHYEPLFHAPGEESRARGTYKCSMLRIVISSWLREILKREHGVDSTVLVTPVNTEVFFPDPERCGSDRRRVRIGMLHHTADWKGVTQGMNAVERVRERVRVPIDLVMFGANKPEVHVDVDELYIRPRQDELRRIYSSLDVFLCSSWREGLGMPAMEAMACGAALVTTDTGGNRDYAVDGVTALVSEPGDADALARNLELAILDEGRRRRLAVEGRRAIEKWDWEENVAVLESLLREA